MKDCNTRILHILGTFDIGGAETMVMNLIRDGMPVDCCAGIPEHGAYEDEMIALGAKTFHLTRRSSSILKHHVELFHIIKNNKYKIVHINTQNSFYALLHIITARLAGAKVIAVHSHNTMDWRSKRDIFLHKMFRKSVYKLADLRFSCGKDAAEWMFGTSEKVSIIPLPVNCRKFQFDENIRNEKRSSLGIDNNEKIFLHIGGFRKVKNHKFLIDTFAKIHKIDANTSLILCGTGDLMEEIQYQVQKYGIEDSVYFMGAVTNVCELCSAADIFLFPSLYEGFPTVLLEAQASGLPCIASDTIDKKVDTGGHIHFLPLNTGKDFWAKTACNTPLLSKEQRILANDDVKKKYDTTIVSQELYQLYLEALEE